MEQLAPTHCARCLAPIVQQPRGRWKRHCDSCAQASAREARRRYLSGARGCLKCGQPRRPRKQYCDSCAERSAAAERRLASVDTSSGWHRKRATSSERQRREEYAGGDYRRARAAVEREVRAGNGRCWRCGESIRPNDAWHLGHDDADRRIIRGAEHPQCNLRAAARKGAQMVNAKSRRALPRW